MSNTVRILHTADLHLGCEFAFLSASERAKRKAELIICCENIFKICHANSIDFLLLSGDVFDSNNVDEQTVNAFVSCFKLAPNTQVIYAAGNHDPLTANSPFLRGNLPENLTILDTCDQVVHFENKGVNIYGKSFASTYMQGSESFSLPISDDGRINIMVLHGDLGSDMSSGYNAITKDFIKNSNMDYVALGHIHEFSGIQVVGKTRYAYSGTPEPHGFDETGNKGVICANIGKDTFEYRFVPTALRRHEEVAVDISDCADNLAAAQKVEEVLKETFGEKYTDNLYKIILCGQVDETYKVNKDEILRRIKDTVYFAKIKDNTEIKINLALAAKENTFKGKFIKNMLLKIEQAKPQDKPTLEKALYLGLKAFGGEVKYNED